VIVILGPTGTGKTSLALEICKSTGAEIISADSRQVYKHMDIGTGKIPGDADSSKIVWHDGYCEIDKVKIWGYDLVNPDQYFSAYDFADFAFNKIQDLKREGKKIVIAGGTGFYIDVLAGRRKLSGTKPDAERRKALETTPTKNLLDKLKLLNSERYEIIDKNNRRRIVRALEVELGDSHDTPSHWKLTGEKFRFIGLSTNRSALYEKADKWVESIWQNGLIEEVRKLMADYPDSDKLDGFVYKSAVSYINGEVEKSEAISRSKYDIHAYIRRQQTWFKANHEIKWFDISHKNWRSEAENYAY